MPAAAVPNLGPAANLPLLNTLPLQAQGYILVSPGYDTRKNHV